MISIIMPLHNGAEFLSDSIPSVLNQTFKEWELIIGVNGLQRDEVAKISTMIHSYGDDRIRGLVCKRGRGKTKALNNMVEESKYDLIATLDVDDTWEPTKLEKQIKVIDKYDVVGTDVTYFGDKDGSPNLFLGRIETLMFGWQNPMINSTVLMHKELAVWKEEWETLDDLNLWIDLLKQGKQFYNIPEVLAHHRVHKKSYYNTMNDEIGTRLRADKIPALTAEEQIYLIDIWNNKKWVVEEEEKSNEEI